MTQREQFEAWLDQYREASPLQSPTLFDAWKAAQAAVMPPGWKLAPIEPTPEMCAAAVRFVNGPAVYKTVTADVLKIEEGIYGEVYAAMLSAAPQPKEPT